MYGDAYALINCYVCHVHEVSSLYREIQVSLGSDFAMVSLVGETNEEKFNLVKLPLVITTRNRIDYGKSVCVARCSR